MKSDIVEAFVQMAKMKSIDRDILESVIKDSFRKMMEKKHGPTANFDIIVNMEKGNIEIFLYKTVVEEVTDPATEIDVESAMEKTGEEFEVGDDYVEEILKLLKLEDKKYFKPNQLSGGQQQRVALARALAIKPAIILADEPTGNLDSRTSQDVLGLIKISSQNLAQTIVMITHNEEIAQMADRIIRIEDGKIVKGGE